MQSIICKSDGESRVWEVVLWDNAVEVFGRWTSDSTEERLVPVGDDVSHDAKGTTHALQSNDVLAEQ